MSTNDVPGYKTANADQLATGCWAEHEDGSLIFVESTEGNRVVYSIFDMSKDPIVEYRDAMPEVNFKKQFSWSSQSQPTGPTATKWTWHDKTPFPWDRVIRAGAQDRGMRYASADDQLTAAERVANSLNLRAREYDHRRAPRRQTSSNRDRLLGMIGSLREQLEELESQVEQPDTTPDLR